MTKQEEHLKNWLVNNGKHDVITDAEDADVPKHWDFVDRVDRVASDVYNKYCEDDSYLET